MYYKQRFLALTCLLGPSHEHIKSLQLLDTGKVVNLQPKNLTAKKPSIAICSRSSPTFTAHYCLLLVLNLGGFHSVMSFLGCMGHVMEASGLKEVLELIYAENAVTQMLSGKAYARAIRGHFLVDTALSSIVLGRAYGVNLSMVDEESDACKDFQEAADLLDKLLREDVSPDEVCSKDVFNRISEKLKAEKSSLAEHKMGKLWIQYMDMIDLLRRFLRALRMGDFLLYLGTLQEMLPYFAACGHNNYAKSAHVYIQDMIELEQLNPDMFCQLNSGLFVIRRSDRLWAGLPSDLVIEQVLMRSLKTNGGLTRGRGMEETQRLRWLLAMPACAEVSEVMQELTGKLFHTSEQHKEMTEARRERDRNDTEKVLAFFKDYDPFQESNELRNIANGVTGPASANPHLLHEVGMNIVQKMEGSNAFDFSFRKKDQVESLGAKVTISAEKVPIDPQLLFQRLLIFANNSDLGVEEVFAYELSSYPTALFDKWGRLREANKPQLGDEIAAVVPKSSLESFEEERTVTHVVDGGSLLQRIPWKKGDTFEDIASMYMKHVSKNFLNPVVVFDGYKSGPTTKDMTHNRRSKGVFGQKVMFTPTMPLRSKKENFLSNSDNKQNFIDLLCETFKANGIDCVNAPADADVMIAKKGIEHARETVVYVIGEDTDLLVLLCHYAERGMNDLYFKSSKEGGKCWHINSVAEALGESICRVLPVVHALCGCDTTSRLYGIGKGAALRKVREDNGFLKCIEAFCCQSGSKNAISSAGEKALVYLYGGKGNDTLDGLRKTKFCNKVAKTSTTVEVHSLPPTTDAAKYHSFRVYCQVQEWMGNCVDPEKWGWCLRKGQLEPKTMDSPVAPDSLLKLVRCQCKGNCDTQRCSCKRNELECSSACGECKGLCQNSNFDASTDDPSEYELLS